MSSLAEASVGGRVMLSHLVDMLKRLTLRRSHEAVEAELGLKTQSVR